ncbi:hypothetical protein GGR57DRAFT_503257 [Xylariaceae sp. FL1272]|nr:hypothetical protein GGR57DRAFT_503257 [Xylariaceae sp. FL1272]
MNTPIQSKLLNLFKHASCSGLTKASSNGVNPPFYRAAQLECDTLHSGRYIDVLPHLRRPSPPATLPPEEQELSESPPTTLPLVREEAEFRSRYFFRQPISPPTFLPEEGEEGGEEEELEKLKAPPGWIGPHLRRLQAKHRMDITIAPDLCLS